MKNTPDITLTLTGDDFDGYRVNAPTDRGASFISAFAPGLTVNATLPATDARRLAEKAEGCSLVVLIQ